MERNIYIFLSASNVASEVKLHLKVVFFSRIVKCTFNSSLHVCFKCHKIFCRSSKVIKTQNSQWKFSLNSEGFTLRKNSLPQKFSTNMSLTYGGLSRSKVTDFTYLLSLLSFTLKVHISALHDVTKGNFTTVFFSTQTKG